MIITIMGTNSKSADVGNTDYLPVPRKGERIEVGYNPPPVVKEVVYNFQLGCVLVMIDGPLMDE